MKTWIIDGHNLIHGWSVLSDLLRADSSATTAQRELVHRVRVLHDFGGAEVEVVFDSRHLKTLSEKWLERQREKGVRVSYGSADTQADTLIEQRVVRHARSGSCVVVTEDRMIRDAVEAAGALSIGASDFIRELQAAEARQTKAVRKLNRAGSDQFGNRLQF